MTERPVRIRRASVADIEVLTELNLLVQQLHVDHEPQVFCNPSVEDVASWFRGVLGEDGSFAALLAVVDEETVGYALFEVVDRPAGTFTRAARLLYIHQIGVRPESRGQGVGRALLERVGREGLDAGASRIGLDTWAFNRDAIGFFEACGFDVFNVRLRRSLIDPPEARPAGTETVSGA